MRIIILNNTVNIYNDNNKSGNNDDCKKKLNFCWFNAAI